MWWAILLSAALGYAVGSVQFGLIVSRLTRGIDVREYGSGATGATNVIRTSGAKAGIAVLLLDIAKGIVPVYAAIGIGHLADLDSVDDRAWCAAAAALAAVIGHVWPVYHGFRGGKAVATGFGGALAMNPLASLALVPVAALVVGVTRIMSVLSITMAPLLAAVFVALAIVDVSPPAYAFYAVPAAAIILYRHSANIRRLLDGTEPKIGQGGERRADAASASAATER
ncbi:MAG TPA: glycerol-3-phosphate 1-O-acyltransferase PlsY, partial [Dehalococcoidia bacterium]|nr:glycerol-3-phosphate 1-O-acyltransferase PlsY [Dehalococcoidia bacterium]